MLLLILNAFLALFILCQIWNFQNWKAPKGVVTILIILILNIMVEEDQYDSIVLVVIPLLYYFYINLREILK